HSNNEWVHDELENNPIQCGRQVRHACSRLPRFWRQTSCQDRISTRGRQLDRPLDPTPDQHFRAAKACTSELQLRYSVHGERQVVVAKESTASKSRSCGNGLGL